MAIDTKKVQDRRSVHYRTFDDLLTDAEQLASKEVRQTGNWSTGQILQHLAVSMNSSIDGFDFSLPAPVRFILSLLMKRKFLYKALPAGFKAAGRFVPPDDVSTADGLAAIRNAVERQATAEEYVPHPGFGKLTRDEWINFHLRHAEMHMSFIVPAKTD